MRARNEFDETDCSDSISEIEGFEQQLIAARLPKKQAWTKVEDKLLAKVVGRYGPANWDILAKYIKSRTGKQCRERYHNILDPNVRKGNWSDEEDVCILSMHASLGNQWARISRALVGRTDNSVKNRFYALMKNKADFEKLPQMPSTDSSDAFSCATAVAPQTGYDIFASVQARHPLIRVAASPSSFAGALSSSLAAVPAVYEARAPAPI